MRVSNARMDAFTHVLLLLHLHRCAAASLNLPQERAVRSGAASGPGLLQRKKVPNDKTRQLIKHNACVLQGFISDAAQLCAVSMVPPEWRHCFFTPAERFWVQILPKKVDPYVHMHMRNVTGPCGLQRADAQCFLSPGKAGKEQSGRG